MKSLTVKFIIEELYDVFNSLKTDEFGFVQTKELIKIAAEKFGCSEQTVRNFLNKNDLCFEKRHGKIKRRQQGSLKEQKENEEEFNAWKKEKEALLDECLDFVKVQTPSPYIDSLLVQIASARNELNYYSDSGLTQLLFDLKREFNFVPKSKKEEGEKIE